FFGRHLAEGSRVTIRHKDRVISKAHRAAHRPNEVSARLALISFHAPIRLRQCQHAYEARREIGCTYLRQLTPDTLHRHVEVAPLASPARRIDAWGATQGEYL